MDYEKLLKEQGGHCALCPRAQKEGGRKLHRDHDRIRLTGRGLLCSVCNRAVLYWMSPEWAEALAAYLRKYENEERKV